MSTGARCEMKRVVLLVVTTLAGDGKEDSPIREVRTVFTQAGDRLGQFDPIVEREPVGDLIREIAEQREET